MVSTSSTSSTGWAYDPTLFSTGQADSNVMVVRRLIGDVLASDQQLQNGEISWAISQYANLYLAAAECSRWIAGQYSRLVDTVQGGGGGQLQTNYSQKAAAYTLRAKELEQRGMSRGGAMPYTGGISIADKNAQEADADRVPPQYIIGMTDNIINPAGQVGLVDIDSGGVGTGDGGVSGSGT